MGINELKRVSPGDRPSARQQNAIVDGLKSLVGRGGKRAIVTSSGVYFRDPPPKDGPPPSAFAARIKSEQNDFLTVRKWDGSEEGTTNILVAKPFKLRHDADNYEGVTGITTTNASTVEATDGTDTETWHVTPSYQVDDVIYVNPVPFTGVESASIELKHVDSNRDGRAWAAEG